MRYKSLIIILFILFFLSLSLFIFWQRVDFNLFWKARREEFFHPLYIIELPPESEYLKDHSLAFYNILQPFKSEREDIFSQKAENILPGLLKTFDVQYVLLRDERYWELFEPFLNYSSEEEKRDLPRTFPVKKEALVSASKPFLILGDGWYAKRKDEYGLTERAFGREAVFYYTVPDGALNQVDNILSFLSPWSPLSEKGKKAEMEIIVNGKLIHSTDSYRWVVAQLEGLQEGVNEIKLRSSQGCLVPDGSDERCISFTIKNVELFSSQNIYSEIPLRLDGFIEIEGGQYLVGERATLRLLAPSKTPLLIIFQIQAVGDEARMISIIEKDKEIKRVILYNKESQKIELLTYQRGGNLFYFMSDKCEEKIIDEKEQCVAVKIENLEIKLLE